MLTIIGRISNYSEAELWDMELEEFNKVQTAFVEAMDNVVKKANAGNSTSS
jgi:anti-sigma regulatory factor (Ser/Thr protein kinase)